MAIFHMPIHIIKRSDARTAVAAAAYRSGTKLHNEYDGETHDYTRKGGVVYTEILLPSHALVSFSDRETLWNSVEKIEKSKDEQLARDIEASLPIELSREEQIRLARDFCSIFVSDGMCADLAIHDKGVGNPHAHIMLTMRPLKEDGTWSAKCRKQYVLGDNSERIRLPSGAFKSEKIDLMDWNQHTKAEEWRKAWADLVNGYLEKNGFQERIDNRSYKRQGVEKIPSVHMGPAATQMERRGIRTERGDINRQIEADNKLLKEIKARITRLYNWSKEQKDAPAPVKTASILEQLHANKPAPTKRYEKVNALKESAKVFSFLQSNGINDMSELYEKITAMQTMYYDKRGEIVGTERRLTVLNERLKNFGTYSKLKGRKRDENDDIMYQAAGKFLAVLKDSGEEITPKKWKTELSSLTVTKDRAYHEMRNMREDLKVVEAIKKTADRMMRETRKNVHEQEI